MNRRAIFVLVLITLCFALVYVEYKTSKEEIDKVAIKDSKINEVQNIKNENVAMRATVEEIRTTPNTKVIFRRHYTDCDHTIEETANMSDDLVNLDKEEFSLKYKGWNIENFSTERVVLKKELNSFCGEHFLLVAENGQILVYLLDENGNKSLNETTDIAFNYLPEADKRVLENGIYVYGVEELNKIKEDFDS